MMLKLRTFILKLTKPYLRMIGRFHLPGTSRNMGQAEVHSLLNIARIGDILLAKKDWEATNLLIQGKFKHAAIVVSDGYVIEAKDPVVVKTGFYDYIMKSDEVVLCRPRYFSEFELLKAEDYAENSLGNGYDYYFVDDNDENYCSELCYEALKSGKPMWGFKRRKILGAATLLPDDFRLSKDNFEIMWQAKSK